MTRNTETPRILSHPANEDHSQRLLTSHHSGVAKRAETLVLGQQAFAPKGTDIATLVEIAAYVHDIGKGHPAFQAYLRGDTRDGPDHAPLGAIAAFHAARQRDIPAADATIPLIAVARHHQPLPSVTTPYEYIHDRYLESYLDDDHSNYLGEQIETIEDHAKNRQSVAQSYVAATDERGEWVDFVKDVCDGTLSEDIKTAITDGFILDTAVKSEAYYATLLQTWSTLTLADKSDAARLNRDRVLPSDTPQRRQTLEERVAGLGNGATDREDTLNEFRNAAFTEVNGEPLAADEGRVHEFIQSNAQTATLTLPTGLGKTYTGLAAAFAIRDATDDCRTVIYCLPYTSIIDQTAADIKDVFGDAPSDERFTVDHYLADTVTTSGSEQSDDSSETGTEQYTRDERFLGEVWQANMVVTTFVQLFESVLGPSNSSGTKLPNIANSVIVLDEPQALPLDDWDIIRDAIHVLTETYGARVILMTATQPRIFEPDNRFEPFSLVEDTSQYFHSETERVFYTFHASIANDTAQLSHEDAARTILDESGSGSTLAICNTIPSTRQLAATINDLAPTTGYDHVDLNATYETALEADEDDTIEATINALLERVARSPTPLVTLHLTTRHRPIDRERLLRIADRLAQLELQFVFVTTQLVEAGVDVSFQRVYRDFAPLDSIVQAGGRCNRNFECQQGRITVWQLESPEGQRPPSVAVYASTGNNLLAVTRDTVRTVVSLPSHDIPGTAITDNAVDQYYERIQSRMTTAPSTVQECNTGQLNAYRMIDERCHRRVNVIVCRTNGDTAEVERIRELFGRRKYELAFDGLDQLADRIISVPIYTPEITPIERQTTLLDPMETITVRWVDAGSSLFDTREGLQNEESVDDFIL